MLKSLVRSAVSALFVFILICGYVLAFLPQPVHAVASWYDSGWLYRKAFTVTGTTGALANYQIEIIANYAVGTDSATNVYLDAKCQGDFDDLRFTESNGTTPINACLMSKTDFSSARVFVNLPTIPQSPATITFYIYYGNSTVASGYATFANTFDTYTKFFIPFEGADASTTFTDLGGHAFTPAADAQIDTAFYKNDLASGLFDGTGDWITTPDTADYDFGTAPYAFSFWFKTSQIGRQYVSLFSNDDVTVTGIAILMNIGTDSDGKIAYYGALGTAKVTTTGGYNDGNWHHLALVRNGTDLQIYIDGTSKMTAVVAAGTSEDATLTAYIGSSVIAGRDYAGSFDNFRIDKGLARWTTNFTPPVATITAWAAIEVATTPLVIQDVKVFTGYKETDDWLVTVRYLDIYAPYYDTYDVRKYFVLQLLDGASVVKAQTVVPAWGNRVGTIYLSAAQATPLTYGGTYSVRLYALFTPNPSVSYTLLSTDWLGSDLVNLDSWIITSATVVGTYYSTSMTTYIAERGEVLNSTGAGIFSAGIAGLSTVRPAIFQTYTVPSVYTPGTITQAGRTRIPAWQVSAGPEATIMLTNLGNIVGIGGDIIAIIFFLIAFFILMGLAFPAGNTTAALVLSLPILGAAIWFGMDLIYIGMLALIAAFLFIKNFWIDKGN